MIDRFRDAPWIVAMDLEHPVVALDLRGPWPTRAGAGQAIASGRRDTAQAWSRAISDSYTAVAALLDRSAIAGGSTNVAVYERAAGALPPRPAIHLPLSHPGLESALTRIADRFGYDLR